VPGGELCINRDSLSPRTDRQADGHGGQRTQKKRRFIRERAGDIEPSYEIEKGLALVRPRFVAEMAASPFTGTTLPE